MDSLSQMALGASLAHVVLGEKLGKKAILLGAVLGTLPDLDVLVPYPDAIESFTYHRSWSHSLFVLSVLSLPLALAVQKFFSKSKLSYTQTLIGVWLVLFTHPLLDAFTTYGTQLFWPLTPPPTAWGSVFIIDPVYTVPLLIGLFIAWRRPFFASRKWVFGMLSLSSLYLGWTLIAQHAIQVRLDQSIAQLDIEARNTLVAPFPFSLLWRSVVQSDEFYYEGYSSLLDSTDTINLVPYDNGMADCAQWSDSWPVQRLNWFTQGMFALSFEDKQIIASDLRIGIAGSYIFRFAIGEQNEDIKDTNIIELPQSRLLPVNVDTARMRQLAKRAIDESVDMAVANSSPDCQ